MRRVLWLLGVGTAAVAAFLLGASLQSRAQPEAQAATVLDQVRGHLAASYYRRVDARILRLRSVESMLAALGDPYTEYLDPASYRLLQRETSGTYGGIGLTALPSRSGLVVTSLQPGPAHAAGIRPGDTILSIDDASVASLSFEQALGRILGRAGTTVELRVRRGPRTLELRVQRRTMRSAAVHTRLLTSGASRVGYMRVTGFSTGVGQALRAAVRRFDARRANGLVLDLRGNHGGVLDSAVSVTSLFLSRAVVVSIEGANQPRRVYWTQGDGKCRLPLVVLVDRETASAAEVVTAALHDNGRAVVVGESTYGKALVQTVQPLAGGAALKLTTARYLTPSGRDISSGGIVPDVLAVDLPDTTADESLAAALHTLLSSTF